MEKVAKDLKLVTVAEERAKEELPPSTARDRDDIELDIINRVEEAKHTAHNNLKRDKPDALTVPDAPNLVWPMDFPLFRCFCETLLKQPIP